MNYNQMKENATKEQKEALQRVEYQLALKIQILFNKELESTIDFRGSILTAAYILSYSGIDEKILTSDYVPKLTVSDGFIGEKIQDARKAAGLTLKNVADKIGCTVGDIRQAEKGNLNIVSREKLGEVFPELAEIIISGRR